MGWGALKASLGLGFLDLTTTVCVIFRLAGNVLGLATISVFTQRPMILRQELHAVPSWWPADQD